MLRKNNGEGWPVDPSASFSSRVATGMVKNGDGNIAHPGLFRLDAARIADPEIVFFRVRIDSCTVTEIVSP